MSIIKFTPEAWRKFRGYIQLVDGEVSGLGRIEYDPYTDNIIIDDIVLFEQTITGASTVMDKNALDKWMLDAMDRDIDISKYRLWWHSHAAMSVFWSGTDEATIKDWDNEQEAGNFFVSVVGNKKGDILGRIDVFSPFYYKFDNVACEVDAPEEDLSDLKAEVDAKVNIPHKQTFNHKKNNRNNLKPVIVDVYKDDREDDMDTIRKFTTPASNAELADRIRRLPEAEQVKGWYWYMYKLGQWPLIRSDAELKAYLNGLGTEDMFFVYRSDAGAIWIPKAPDCKWYQQSILEDVKNELTIADFENKERYND